MRSWLEYFSNITLVCMGVIVAFVLSDMLRYGYGYVTTTHSCVGIFTFDVIF